MPEALRPEDYAEPRCVLCDEPYGAEPEIRAVPQERIVRKMNEYMARRDYPGGSGTSSTGWRRRSSGETSGES